MDGFETTESHSVLENPNRLFKEEFLLISTFKKSFFVLQAEIGP